MYSSSNFDAEEGLKMYVRWFELGTRDVVAGKDNKHDRLVLFTSANAVCFQR
jgi:hypothetical protein